MHAVAQHLHDAPAVAVDRRADESIVPRKRFDIRTGSRSHSCELPSMSVKRR
jgi:hypothetical protein